jgi:site-specific DNA-methyltransferase (adenine-specific)
VLINQSSQQGELVADPFMGSGSVGVAALKLGRRFIGTDLNPAAVRLTADRLREFGAGREPEGLPTSEQANLLEMMGSER